MQVILFYAVLIAGVGLAAGAYVAYVASPAILIGYRMGLFAGAAYSAATAGVMYVLFKPPYGGAELEFVPAGLRPSVYMVGLFKEPPTESLIAGATMGTAGFVVAIVAWLLRRMAA